MPGSVQPDNTVVISLQEYDEIVKKLSDLFTFHNTIRQLSAYINWKERGLEGLAIDDHEIEELLLFTDHFRRDYG